MRLTAFCSALLLAAGAATAGNKTKEPEPTPLELYLREALARRQGTASATSGSLWSPASRMTDLGSDLRAAQVDDMVTILVTERASAIAKGTVKTGRQSNLKASVGSIAGVTRAAGPLKNLASASGESQLNGEGETTRETSLSTTLTARVSQVLPNGYLLLEATKDVMVNSERQVVTVRGVVRPVDLTTGNVIQSDQIAQLEIRVNGKGVVGDAIRRPFILYRILMGILPF
jgi:flagellar L-ring protein precursor FlgH